MPGLSAGQRAGAMPIGGSPSDSFGHALRREALPTAPQLKKDLGASWGLAQGGRGLRGQLVGIGAHRKIKPQLIEGVFVEARYPFSGWCERKSKEAPPFCGSAFLHIPFCNHQSAYP